MKKVFLILLILIILAIAYWLVSPLFIDKRVSEEFPSAEKYTATSSNQTAPVTPEIVATGTFSGFDRIHYGSGDVRLIKTEMGYVIRFEENFEVANGPDLFVGLGKDGVYKEEAQLEHLKGNIGSQNYLIPEHIDIDAYNEVWVWCRAFSVPFAKASLLPSGF
ncbi:MAG: DM13 domain-containing protein [Patescibacteria group bacterium]